MGSGLLESIGLWRRFGGGVFQRFLAAGADFPGAAPSADHVTQGGSHGQEYGKWDLNAPQVEIHNGPLRFPETMVQQPICVILSIVAYRIAAPWRRVPIEGVVERVGIRRNTVKTGTERRCKS
jgi:hypothetical protein